MYPAFCAKKQAIAYAIWESNACMYNEPSASNRMLALVCIGKCPDVSLPSLRLEIGCG